LAFLAYLVFYFFIDQIYYWIKKRPYKGFTSEKLKVKIKLLTASFLDWFFAYLFFVFIVKQFNKNIDVYIILEVFTLASVAGIASLLQGSAWMPPLRAVWHFLRYAP
jgi:uncharacterized membrane protein YbhN (UPF0104 family)